MSEPDDEQVAPALVKVIEELVDDLTAAPSDRNVVRRLEWLIEALIRRGHLTDSNRSLLRRIRGEASVVRLAVYPDKRAVPSTERDCASLLHLCKGRCCALDVSLSAGDVAERKLEWDLQRPYLLRKNPAHGYCACLDDGGRCTVYDDRPGTCRDYDCADDPRVWQDWEQKIPAPLPWLLVPPEEWKRAAPEPARPEPAEAASDGAAGPTVADR